MVDALCSRAGTLPGTLQAALTETELELIHTPPPLPSIQLGRESLPYTHNHLSMLYWRLGLCANDKFESLALGSQLNDHIDGLGTE